MSAIDDREYVDWKDYPNIVKFKANHFNPQTFERETFSCTGTEIGKYVITAAHCVEGFYNFTIERNDGESVKIELLSKGAASNPDTDWAILELPNEVESKYILSQDIISDFGALYGFGGLRILTDEELIKVREYLYSNNAFNADDAVELLESDIPGIGYIYNDSDRLKMSPCSAIRKTENGVEALCVSSGGNSGGGLFIDNKEVGILSKGSVYINRGMAEFASIKSANDVMQKFVSKSCDEEFIRDVFKVKYNDPKEIRRINDFYIVQGSGISLLTDLCGNVLLDKFAPSAKRIISLEHKGNQYIIEETAPKIGVLVSGCDEIVQNQINGIFLERNYKIETKMYLIQDDNTNKQTSYDGGKTFYKNGREAVARFLFTPEEFDNMPDEWKECLRIR